MSGSDTLTSLFVIYLLDFKIHLLIAPVYLSLTINWILALISFIEIIWMHENISKHHGRLQGATK